ncbi:MAG: hypothetical protein M3R06_09590 [Chloroflexota bacterium]|nr:hypothetical protein [Chloroflexota bacterium]
MFGDQFAGPEEIDEAAFAADLFGGEFEEGALAAAVDAEDGQELAPERLALALFIFLALPVRGELASAVLDFIPIHLNRFQSIQ